MCDDAEANRWIPLPAPYTLAEAETWIGDAERRWREDHWATFIVCDATSGDLLGSNGVRVDHTRQSGEIGYLTKHEARRGGVASGGVRLLVAWCFDVLELGRLQIRADVRNVASRAVIESCGFRFEGVLRAYDLIHDERPDDALYSLLPGDPRPW
jgi:RimJ/RimL family protein N-acetyltransferase